MKKLNNKGFAISTLIYGLAVMGVMIVAILMATMAQTRVNNTSLVKAIEDDLNRFSKTETSFNAQIVESKPAAQEYIVPTSGWYTIELWGTQGGGNGGKGAYTKGTIELKQGDILYFYVGKHNSNIGGGYATEVRVTNGDYIDPLSYVTRIMVAGGGGSSANASGGTIYGYNTKMISYGGYIDSAKGKDFSLIQKTDENEIPTNGTLLGYDKDYTINNAVIPNPINTPVSPPIGSENGNGGDGYFPSNNADAGGASYIAGYAGCYGISKGRLTNDSKLEYYESFYDGYLATPYTYSNTLSGEYYFIDGMMLPGVKTGDGYAKIVRVKEKEEESETLIRKNTKLNRVRRIKDCVRRTCLNDNEATSIWSRIIASFNGKTFSPDNITYDNVTMTSGLQCPVCATIDFGDTYDIDEIAVFHTDTGIDYKNHVISVSSTGDGNDWVVVKDWTLKDKGTAKKCEDFENVDDQKECTNLSETETVSGYRISAYQNDATKALPNGTYIIQSVLSENKVLTATESLETNANSITIEPYNGEKRQKWSIELITDTRINKNYVPNDSTTYEYKIIETARFKALSITQDENIVGNTLSAIDKFNEKARNEPQIWKIKPIGNGTYTIETVSQQVTPTANTGSIVPQTNNSVDNTYNKVIIGKNNIDTARWKLIQIDYSSK